MSFLGKDGYINVAEFVLLARDIDKLAVSEGLKPAELYFSSKAIVKEDHPSKKKLDEAAFTKKRAQIIKRKSRMPASGSRMRMMVLLRNYKKLDQYEDYWKDYCQALKALERHNAKAEKVVAHLKAAAAKKRDALNASFDRNIDAITNILLDGGLTEDDIAFGSSMMGKTMLVRLPNKGVVSIGKADMERFNKALDDAEDAAPAKKKPVAKSRTVATRKTAVVLKKKVRR